MLVRWSSEDDAAVRAMTEGGKSDAVIAAALNRTPAAVERRRATLSISRGDARAWAEEAIETLRTLWGEGKSCAQIAALIGVTRNAVIGKANRLKLGGRAAPSKPGKARLLGAQRRALSGAPKSRKVKAIKPRKSPPGLRLGAELSPVEKPPVILPDDAFQPLPGDTHLPWEQRRLGECAWPLDVAGEVFSCCRSATRAGYCETHAAIGFRTEQATSAKEYARGLRRWAA